MFKQLALSYRMTLAATKMTMRYPLSLVVALANLVALVFVAVGPIAWMILLFEKDPARAWWVLNHIFQFRIVTNAWETGGLDAAVPAFAWWLLVIYVAWMTVVSFLTMMAATVIMHTGVMQLRGQAPSLAEGFRVAGRNAPRIAGLALLAGAVLGLVRRFSAVLSAVPIAGRFLRHAIMAALTGLLYLALPVVVYERDGVVSALRSTWRNMRQTWGGLVVGTGLMMSAVWLGLWVTEVAVLTLVDGMLGSSLADWTTLLVLQVFTAVALYCVNVTLSANLRAALYLHVTEGHTGVIPETALVSRPAGPAPRAPLEAAARTTTTTTTTTFELVRRE